MKVSVIIPTYNRARLVQESIDSVLQQSFRDFEIIVIDDGSTDDTEQVLQRFSSQIRYIKQGNRGLNAARNRAIDLSQGEYIAFLDSDDLWRRFKLEVDVSVLDSYPDVGFVFSDFCVLKPDGREVCHGLHAWFAGKPQWNDVFESSTQWELNAPGTEAIDQGAVTIYTGDIYYTSLFGPRVLPSASLFRKAKAADWLPLNENDSYCGDWAFFAQLSHQHGAVFVDLETALNRSHDDAVRLTRADQRIWIRKRVEMISHLWKRDDEFYGLHRVEVDGELARLVSQLLKLHLLAGDRSAAKQAIGELKGLTGAKVSLETSLYKLLAASPGVPRLLPKLRSLRRKIGIV